MGFWELDVDLTQDHFSNFGLLLAFQVDLAYLADRYHQLQQVYHPDRFVSGTDAEQRVAVQTASYLNQAYTILRCPFFCLVVQQNADPKAEGCQIKN